MSSFAPYPHGPEHKGKMLQKGSIKRVGQATQKGHLGARMKADDSKTVLMSDQTLGRAISSK